MTRSLTLLSLLVASMSCSHEPKHAEHGAGHHGQHSAHQPGHAHAGGMPHRFENAQEWVAVFDDPARDAWQKPDEVVAALALKPDDIVADLGAGTGYFTMRLAKAVPQGSALGVDVEQGMVDHLIARAQKEGLTNVKGIVCPPDDAALPDGVNVVLVVDTYHHISDRVAYFTKVAAKLAPGGRLVIVDFKPESERGPPKEFKMAAAQVESELKAAGFTVTKTHAFLPDQYFLELSKTGG
jgi:cyclopropane fatty-acyl-phospholipid synthase-like methyltransferase